MSKQAAPCTVVHVDTPEATATDVRHPVVSRQTLVHEREVGIDQIDDAAVFAENRLEQELGLALERQTEVAVKLPGRGRDALQLAQQQPLPRYVVHHRLSPRIGQHPPRLLLEHRGFGEPAGTGSL